MALAGAATQNRLSSGTDRAGTLEWPLLWASAIAVFVLPEARIRVSIAPLEIGLVIGFLFCFLRFVRLQSFQSRIVFAALLLCSFEIYYYALHWMAGPFPLAV